MNIVDLRLGNYVEYNGMSAVVTELLSPKPRKPESFNGVPVVELFCGGLINALLSEINPIPITEEILLRFGFYRTEYNDYRHPILIGTLTLYEGIAELHLSDIYSVWVDNLHQLQNLFYCLCGEELEVKL